MWASVNGHVRVVEILISAGASTTPAAVNGKTCFELAKNEDTRVALKVKTADLSTWLKQMGYELFSKELLKNPVAVIVLTGLKKRFENIGSKDEEG